MIQPQNDENECASCVLLQFYANRDTFVCDIGCLFCGQIITNQNKQEEKNISPWTALDIIITAMQNKWLKNGIELFIFSCENLL